MNKPVILILFFIVFSCNTKDKRPQEPAEPLSYQSEEVSFQSHGSDIKLAGTLTTPKDEDTKVAVVLVGGSGRSDRDYGNQFGHRPFLVIADYLTRNGIAVLRYDERGVGKSEGDYPSATFEALASDLAGGVKLLRDRGYGKVGIIGHSEGGSIAPVTSFEEKTDFLVLLAADNFTADVTLIYQTANRLRSMGVDTGTSEEIIENLDKLLAIAKTEPNKDAAKARMETVISESDAKTSEDYKRVTNQLGDPHRLIDGFLDPKFIYRLHNTTRQALKKVRIPVLVVYGDSDETINVKANVAMMENALDSTQHEVKVFPGLGHLFMNSQGVPISELHTVEETIAPDVLEFVGGWIKGLTN